MGGTCNFCDKFYYKFTVNFIFGKFQYQLFNLIVIIGSTSMVLPLHNKIMKVKWQLMSLKTMDIKQ